MLPRSQTFATPVRQSLVNNADANLQDHVRGPVSMFNPTRARFDIPATSTLPEGYGTSSEQGGREQQKAGNAVLAWRARDNRKGATGNYSRRIFAASLTFL